jgi:adenylate kinase family enzyme
VSNNNAALALWGCAGSGKSTIAEALKKAFNGHELATRSNFQAPEIAKAGIISISEATWKDLKSSDYKNLTDFRASVKQ